MKFKLDKSEHALQHPNSIENRLPHVVTYNGKHWLVMPDGEAIPGVQMTRVKSDQDNFLAEVLVRFVAVISTGEIEGEES